MRVLDQPLSKGFEGIRKTVLPMAVLIKAGSKSEQVRELAKKLTAGARSELEKIIRIFNWIKSHIRYTPDPDDIEQLKTPTRMLTEISQQGHARGDCDDYTILFNSVLEAAGIRTRIKVLNTAGYRNFNHVVPEAQHSKGWIMLDATLPDGRPGRLLGKVKRSFVFNYGV